MSRLHFSHIKIISLKLTKRISLIVFSIFVFENLFFSLPILANEINGDGYTDILEQNLTIRAAEEEKLIRLPENPDRTYTIKYSKYTTITAYNSIPGQTDDTPCITANGFNVCEHGIEDTVAANFLKFGTKIKIPDIFGDRIFIVRDRMNRRYTNRVDIWMLNRDDALVLGKRLAKIEILE